MKNVLICSYISEIRKSKSMMSTKASAFLSRKGLKTINNDLILIWSQQISCIHRIKIMNINVLLPVRHFILRAIPLRVSSLRRCKHSSLGAPSTAGRRIYDFKFRTYKIFGHYAGTISDNAGGKIAAISPACFIKDII